MVASDLLRERTYPWVSLYGREFLRVLTPMPVLAIIWWLQTLNLGLGTWIYLVVYGAVTLGWTALIRSTHKGAWRARRRLLFRLSVMSDIAAALILLAIVPPLSGIVLPLLFVFTLRALCYQNAFQWVLLTPALIGPVYFAVLTWQGIQGSSWTPTMEGAFATLLISSLSFCVIILWGNISRQREQNRLLYTLDAERHTYEEQITELNDITNDLRVHIRSQQALEESLRAVTGSLSRKEVLRQILDSTAQMLGPYRVDGAAVSLRNGDGFTNHLLTLDSTLESGWADLLARHVLQVRTTLLVDDTAATRQWQSLYERKIGTAISLPLISEDGQVIGALSVVSRQTQAFSLADARHLNAFGIQACVAIRNAELHTQVRGQWSMLEAVLRDLGDGLIIYDHQARPVFANPVAERFLTLDEESNEVQQQVEKLVQDIHNGGSEIMWSEIQGIATEADPPVYQAIASQAHVGDNAANLVAVVLHDVTATKAEERARAQFVSMVSHELRNPLHTLSGFLKVVLQGRAGALNPVQQDFLQTAEEQVDKLHGRINELLEFNRLESGNMRLERAWSDLPNLAATTISALTLQAEQAGLALINDVKIDIPDILMDGKRIGQVLTNLIENAIKATPPLGVINVSAALVDDSIRVSVQDTGTGITEADTQKIFDPFYGTMNRSNYGVHLGLGLAICQQIIQGHGGTIWVESEHGAGSTFSFTLPLVAREHPLEMASLSH